MFCIHYISVLDVPTKSSKAQRFCGAPMGAPMQASLRLMGGGPCSLPALSLKITDTAANDASLRLIGGAMQAVQRGVIQALGGGGGVNIGKGWAPGRPKAYLSVCCCCADTDVLPASKTSVGSAV